MNYKSYLLMFAITLSLFSSVYPAIPSYSTSAECEYFCRRGCARQNKNYYCTETVNHNGHGHSYYCTCRKLRPFGNK